MSVNGTSNYSEHILSEVNVSSGIFAACLIIAGLVFLFAGIRFFKPIIAAAAFFQFSVIGYAILESVDAQKAFGSNREWAYLLIILFIGLAGASLALWVWKVGLFSIGALAGYALASFILACGVDTESGLINNLGGRVTFIIVFMLIGVVMMIFLERPMIVIGTAMVGAHAILYGIDIYAGTGYKNTSSAFLTGKLKYKAYSQVLGILISFAIIVLFGIAVQFKLTGKGLPAYSKR